MKKIIPLLFILASCGNRFGAASTEKCTEKLPKTVKIVYSEMNNNYAVKIDALRKGDWIFLWDMKASQGYYWSFEPLTTFSDSCEAKNAAFKYIDQNRRIKSYK